MASLRKQDHSGPFDIARSTSVALALLIALTVSSVFLCLRGGAAVFDAYEAAIIVLLSQRLVIPCPHLSVRLLLVFGCLVMKAAEWC